MVDLIASLEPTLGGINLEDIKAPECFYIEQKLRDRLNIPVFHDDQHGTAIISSAALLNGLKVVGGAEDRREPRGAWSGSIAAAIEGERMRGEGPRDGRVSFASRGRAVREEGARGERKEGIGTREKELARLLRSHSRKPDVRGGREHLLQAGRNDYEDPAR